MDKEIREKIALKRYQLISPVLAEPARAQNEYFRKQAQIEYDFPRYGLRKVSVSTMKAWLRKYREKGFDSLKPKNRSDGGRPRRLDEGLLKAIEIQCRAHPSMTVQMLFEELRNQDLLGYPPVHYNTLLRVVKKQGWLSPRGRADASKTYEVGNVNDLWTSDFMHGPQVRTANRSAKTILCALLDDHSRMLVGHAFSASGTISALTVVLKEAFLAYGIPKRLYVDNSSAFSSDLLTRSCAQAGIALIHSKPYESPSRGKLDRFFRTVRERFLSGLQESITLRELNEAFALWLKDDYHHKLHTGIGERPVDRYNSSVGRVLIRRLSREELDEIFLVRHERVVNHDATIRFKGALYEVPAAYIHRNVEIRHHVDAPEELYLYDNGLRVGKIKLLDKQENTHTFRPQELSTHLPFHKGEALP
jgi:transposase InsO family protein